MTVIQLWTKNRRLARLIARDYYFPGSERQDVEQEAMIGLWIAARDYREHDGTFNAFARLIIKRRLDSCLKMASRSKHSPLNHSLRALVNDEGESVVAVEELPCLHQVTDAVENRERLRVVLAAINTDLTDFERHCVLGIARGDDYLELGEYKRVDNALMRARRKLRHATVL